MVYTGFTLKKKKKKIENSNFGTHGGRVYNPVSSMGESIYG